MKPQDLEKSLEISQANVTHQQWFEFISNALVLFGLASLAVGVIFFFAYNWDDMSKMMKFALLQSLLALSAVFYTQINRQSNLATGMLLFIALLIGALLALFGQTYQTGKDPWQLFFMWSLFVTPIAFISKNSLLWILWLGLINLTLQLFLSVHSWFLDYLFRNIIYVLFFAGLNLLATLIIYFGQNYSRKSSQISAHNFLNKEYKTAAFYTAIIATIIAVTWFGFYTVIDNSHTLFFIVYALFMAAVFYLFRKKTCDVLILSAWSLSLILVSLSLFARLFDDSWNGGTLLILSILLIAASTFATKWLMSLLHDEQLESAGEAA
ncbi:MAG TPA: DUF2157 domain-containing protein [Oceanospirillales bacterium]|nr:DUF2157 domain-containing protein [Oceanospirillales bacterium]